MDPSWTRGTRGLFRLQNVGKRGACNTFKTATETELYRICAADDELEIVADQRGVCGTRDCRPLTSCACGMPQSSRRSMQHAAATKVTRPKNRGIVHSKRCKARTKASLKGNNQAKRAANSIKAASWPTLSPLSHFSLSLPRPAHSCLLSAASLRILSAKNPQKSQLKKKYKTHELQSQ